MEFQSRMKILERENMLLRLRLYKAGMEGARVKYVRAMHIVALERCKLCITRFHVYIHLSFNCIIILESWPL